MLELLGKKYYDIFRAGEYPQATVTVEMLQRVAHFYNKTTHEACVWLGHPDEYQTGKDEPEALAWVGDLLCINDLLYCSFSSVSDKMMKLIEDKKFKFTSIELRYYMINDVKTEYLYAVGLTNRPAVNGLNPLEFPKRFTDTHNFNLNFVGDSRLTFELQNSITNNFTNPKDNPMNQFLIDTAKAVGLDVTKFTTESSLKDAITKAFTDKTTEIGTLQTEVTALKNAVPEKKEFTSADKALADKVGALENLLFTQLADNAIASKKIMPAQRDFIVASAKANYAETLKYVESLPVQSVLETSVVKDGLNKDAVDLNDPKFNDDKGRKLTYSEVIKDDKLRVLFTGAELTALKNVDPKYKSAK